jgi:MmyB-like transcription regulator ligand binding domain
MLSRLDHHGSVPYSGSPGRASVRAVTKHIDHPVLGPLEIDCQVLLIPDTDQRLVVYTSPPGTPLHEAHKSLRTTVG